MPPNSIQTGLIEHAKARLPQTKTVVDCFKVPLTLDLEGEGFRCSSRRHLIPRSDRRGTCQCRCVRLEHSGLRKLTAALLWPLIWKCCVKSRGSSGILTYSHNSRSCGTPGSFSLFEFYLLFISACFSVAIKSGWRHIKEGTKIWKIWVMFTTLFAVDAYGGVYCLHLCGGHQKNEYYFDFTILELP